MRLIIPNVICNEFCLGYTSKIKIVQPCIVQCYRVFNVYKSQSSKWPLTCYWLLVPLSYMFMKISHPAYAVS
ncbi:hypothetical protein XELAEV_18005402mg [Xenopus laevis]|uniref:Uncharacterized protein n=1 Tax=Xenopus laevis TaxID=8355 RepID=A0A974I330_XENLA|nr:hypothetical protein XELAEV_18005402mg [Xenopus laevis]